MPLETPLTSLVLSISIINEAPLDDSPSSSSTEAVGGQVQFCVPTQVTGAKTLELWLLAFTRT